MMKLSASAFVTLTTVTCFYPTCSSHGRVEVCPSNEFFHFGSSSNWGREQTPNSQSPKVKLIPCLLYRLSTLLRYLQSPTLICTCGGEAVIELP
nr:hypothetical protein HmN_000131200 [Hymenolepis microstoma]